MSTDALLIWGLVLMGVAIVLLALEVFVPSGGVISVISAICAIGGIGMLFKHDTGWGVTGMLTMLILMPITLAWGFKMLPSTPIGRAILGGRTDDEREEIERAERDRAMRLRALVGLEGVALTDMRPVGEVDLGDEVIEAYAEHDWIEAGQRVVVTHAGGFEIKVRRA